MATLGVPFETHWCGFYQATVKASPSQYLVVPVTLSNMVTLSSCAFISETDKISAKTPYCFKYFK